MITKYMIEIQMAGRQKNIKSIKLAPMLYSAKHVNPHTAVFFWVRRFIGKQKQICQGPTIGLPPHQTRSQWVPNSQNRWRNGYPKGQKWKFSYTGISSIPVAHAEYTSTNVIPPVGAVAAVKRLPCHISQFVPTFKGGKNQQPLV